MKNLCYQIILRLNKARVKRDIYHDKGDQRMQKYWAGKVKAYFTCLKLVNQNSEQSQNTGSEPVIKNGGTQ